MSSKILDLFQYKARIDYRDELFQKIRADYPLLAAALIGNYDAKEKTGQKGGTLMIFIDEDVLKWTFHHRIARITLFGSFPDMTLDLEMIEQAMAAGSFDRKNGSGK